MPNPNIPVFPNNTALDTDLFVASGKAISNLSLPLNAVSTTFTINDASRFIAPCLVQIDTEIIAIGQISNNVCSNCIRGFSNTTATAHAQSSSVKAYFFSYQFNQLAAEIIAIESTLGSNLENVLTPSNLIQGDLDLVSGRLVLGDTGVLSGKYGSSTQTPVLEINSAGRIISVATQTISGGGGGGTGFILTGAWNSATNYISLDVVSYNGSSYVAIISNTNIIPGTDGGTIWQVLSLAGAPGPPGSGGSLVISERITIPYTLGSFKSNSTSATVFLNSSILPAYTKILGVTIYPTQTFTGPGFTNITCQIGSDVNDSTVNAFATPYTISGTTSSLNFLDSSQYTSTTMQSFNVLAQFNSTASNFGNGTSTHLTGGSVDIIIVYVGL